MKTIEERAKEYIYRNGLMHCGMGYCDAKEAYIEIAAEQKKIDIDKACEWTCKDCDHCVADVDRKARCPRLDSLRKAMEGTE